MQSGGFGADFCDRWDWGDSIAEPLREVAFQRRYVLLKGGKRGIDIGFLLADFGAGGNQRRMGDEDILDIRGVGLEGIAAEEDVRAEGCDGVGFAGTAGIDRDDAEIGRDLAHDRLDVTAEFVDIGLERLAPGSTRGNCGEEIGQEGVEFDAKRVAFGLKSGRVSLDGGDGRREKLAPFEGFAHNGTGGNRFFVQEAPKKGVDQRWNTASIPDCKNFTSCM